MLGWLIFYDEKSPQFKLRIHEATKHAQIKLIDIDCSKLQLIFDHKKTRLLYEQAEIEPPDFIILYFVCYPLPSCLHILQRISDLGIPIINSLAATKLARNKWRSLLALTAEKIPIPKSALLHSGTILPTELFERFHFPAVLKVNGGSNGKGVALINTKTELIDLLGVVGGTTTNYELILQTFIDAHAGTHLRVVVIGGKAITAVKLTTTTSFKSNTAFGGKLSSLPLTPELTQIAEKAAKAHDLSFAGVDVLICEHGYKICEVNSAPAIIEMEALCKIDIAQILLDHIASKVSRNKVL